MDRYPKLVIDAKKLRENIDSVIEKCEALGIRVTGIVKGMNGIPELLDVYEDSDCDMIGSSRIEQLRDAKERGIKKPTMMIRIPMPSEAADVIKYADYSLNSEDYTLRVLNDEAIKQGKKHNVLLMAEMGDLREGYVDETLIEGAKLVEEELDGLTLAGVAMNVGCYGSILPTREKLDEFVEKAEEVEAAIGRKLDIISGGATSTLMRVLDGDIPGRINHLRIGEGILLAYDLETFYDIDMSFLNQDVFMLEGEVVEVKDKPTFPDGEIGRDAFGHTPEYIDEGIRKRAIIAMGKLDYGDIGEIRPVDEGARVIGASSDHTIVDVEDVKRELKVGDIMEFRINYASMIYLTASRNVHIAVKR